MNKKNNRKGFTIVELVIVIAVIAILATVLVPTFGNVIENAKNTALIQEIKNEHTNYTMKFATSDDYSEDIAIKIDNKYYQFVNGSIATEKDEKGNEKAIAMETNPHTYYDPTADDLGYNHTAGEGNKCTVCQEDVPAN